LAADLDPHHRDIVTSERTLDLIEERQRRARTREAIRGDLRHIDSTSRGGGLRLQLRHRSAGGAPGSDLGIPCDPRPRDPVARRLRARVGSLREQLARGFREFVERSPFVGSFCRQALRMTAS